MKMELKYRVNLDDLDFMGIVSHYQWIELFERARTELVKETWKSFLKAQLGIAIAEINVKYRKPARYDDEVTFSIEPIKLGSRSVCLRHIAKSNEDEIYCEADIVGVFIDKTGKPTSVPNSLKDLFNLND